LKGPPLVAGTGKIKTVVVLDGMKSNAVPDWMKSGEVYWAAIGPVRLGGRDAMRALS
jgi:hypothetical protein